MLAIRLQRTGRKGYPTYRFIVQEAHRQPTSGRIVANLGNYNPHTKDLNLDKEAAERYLSNGAQPSGRVIKLFAAEKMKLPSWVKLPVDDRKKTIKNAEKLRKNQPKDEATRETAVEESEAGKAPAEATKATTVDTDENEVVEDKTEA